MSQMPETDGGIHVQVTVVQSDDDVGSLGTGTRELLDSGFMTSSLAGSGSGQDIVPPYWGPNVTGKGEGSRPHAQGVSRGQARASSCTWGFLSLRMHVQLS